MGIRFLETSAKPLKFILALCLWLAAGPVFAQPSAENQTRFDNARALVDRGQLELAMQELRPLMQSSSNSFAPDATYLYAVAAYRAGKLQEAATALTTFAGTFPNWPGLPDMHYLYGAVLFAQDKPEQALSVLQAIPENQLQAEQAQLKRHHLTQIKDRTRLAELYRKFPDDKSIAAAYADLLIATYRPADKPVLDHLVSAHKLDKSKFAPPPATVKKPSYRVGILFPFGMSTTDLSQRNQFVVDLYEGIRYASDSLAKQNINLELFTYETGSDTNKLKQVLAMPELQTMDLIIGPVYKSGSSIISRFANQHRIPVVNPLSEDGELMAGSNYLYLFESSLQTKARKLAEFAYTNFQPTNGLVVFQNRRDDSTLAVFYRQEFEKLGGKINVFKKISAARSSANTATISSLDTTGVGHMAIFAESPNVAVNVLSMIDRNNFRGGVLVPSAWLELQQIPLEQLDARDIYFIGPHQIEPTKPGVSTFRKGYQSRTNLPPSVYATTGFDLLWYFGQQLHRNGTGFAQQLPVDGYRPGALYSGFDYSKSNDNSFVPLFKLENLELLRANNASSAINLLPPPPPEPKKDEQKPPKK